MTTDTRMPEPADDELTDAELRALAILLDDDPPEDTDGIILILSGRG
jgi:hypothetical protein